MTSNTIVTSSTIKEITVEEKLLLLRQLYEVKQCEIYSADFRSQHIQINPILIIDINAPSSHFLSYIKKKETKGTFPD